MRPRCDDSRRETRKFDVNAITDQFPGITSAIQQGIARQLHTGVQIYVSLDSQPVLDTGIGTAGEGKPMTADTVMLWRSAGKPITGAAVCRLLESGQLSLNTRLGDCLPATQATATEHLTLQQLLTHTSGLPVIDTGWPHSTWAEVIQRCINTTPVMERAAYQPQSTWFLLGEIVRIAADPQRSFQDVLRTEVLQPLGLNETWCGIPDSTIHTLKDRLPTYLERNKGQLTTCSYGDHPWLQSASPGGNLRGPVRELGRFYETLLNDDASQSDGWLQPETIRLMTSRHRTDQFDETLQHVVDFGLSVIVDSNHHGIDTVPYGFGRHCSARTFGHGGAQCAMGFCDPERRLVVAWAANGFCGEGHHQRRNRAINEAVYADLGFV